MRDRGMPPFVDPSSPDFLPTPEPEYGGAGGDDYGHWSKVIENLQIMDMSTYTSFMSFANFKRGDPMIEYCNIANALGTYELEAPCNNRLERIANIQKEIYALEDKIQEMDEDDDWRDEVPIDSSLWSDTNYVPATLPRLSQRTLPTYRKHIRGLKKQVTHIRRGIKKDEENNVFRDYGFYKSLFNHPDPNKALNGKKYRLAPYFLKIAMQEVAGSAQGTFRDHGQSTFSKIPQHTGIEEINAVRRSQLPAPAYRSRPTEE